LRARADRSPVALAADLAVLADASDACDSIAVGDGFWIG
jgi:hypothetical protein